MTIKGGHVWLKWFRHHCCGSQPLHPSKFGRDQWTASHKASRNDAEASHHPSSCMICVPSMFQSINRRGTFDLKNFHKICKCSTVAWERFCPPSDIACWRGRPLVLPHLCGHHFPELRPTFQSPETRPVVLRHVELALVIWLWVCLKIGDAPKLQFFYDD